MTVEFDCADCGAHVVEIVGTVIKKAGWCLECRAVRSVAPQHRPMLWKHFHPDIDMPEYLKTLEPQPLLD